MVARASRSSDRGIWRVCNLQSRPIKIPAPPGSQQWLNKRRNLARFSFFDRNIASKSGSIVLGGINRTTAIYFRTKLLLKVIFFLSLLDIRFREWIVEQPTEPNFNLSREKDFRLEDFELSEEENGYFHSPGTRICYAGLSLPRVADYDQFDGGKKERKKERDRILVPRSRREQRIVEQSSRGSPRHPLLPSEFSIVPLAVPLAIFARLALSQIRFPPPSHSLSLLVPSVQLSALLLFLQRGENARIPRETAVFVRSTLERAWNHACGLLNLFVFFPLSFLPPHRWNNSNDQSCFRTSIKLPVVPSPMLLLSRERRLKSTVETSRKAMGLSRWWTFARTVPLVNPSLDTTLASSP